LKYEPVGIKFMNYLAQIS